MLSRHVKTNGRSLKLGYYNPPLSAVDLSVEGSPGDGRHIRLTGHTAAKDMSLERVAGRASQWIRSPAEGRFGKHGVDTLIPIDKLGDAHVNG